MPGQRPRPSSRPASCRHRRRHRAVALAAALAGTALAALRLAGVAAASAFSAPGLRGAGSAAAIDSAAEGTVPRPTRRDVALAGPAGLAALLGLAAGQEAALAAPGREEVVNAAALLRSIQQRWGEFEKAGGDQGLISAGEALLNVIGSTSELKAEVNVPAGSVVGVDIEGRAVTAVTKKGLGWQQGDFLEQINGADLKDEDDVVKKVKQAKESNAPMKFLVSRRFQTPFVTINKSLRLIYEDTNAALSEQEDVVARIGNLKVKAGLMADGIGDLADIKKRLDLVVADLEAYAAAPSVADAPPPQKAKAEGGGGSDMSELFA